MDKLIEKFQALALGEKIVIIAGVVLFIVSFLAWGDREVFGIDVNTNDSAWGGEGAIFSILAVLVGLATAGVIIVRMFASEGTVPENISGITWPRIHLGLGLAVVVLVVLRILIDGDLEIGAVLGFIAAAALAVGGFLMFREESAS